jgi:heme/copper-type cytochrome/quinol oxidase subunit 2
MLILLALLWSVQAAVFHAWMTVAAPERLQPNETLAYVYMVASPILLLAMFIVPLLIRRKARAMYGGRTPARR